LWIPRCACCSKHIRNVAGAVCGTVGVHMCMLYSACLVGWVGGVQAFEHMLPWYCVRGTALQRTQALLAASSNSVGKRAERLEPNPGCSALRSVCSNLDDECDDHSMISQIPVGCVFVGAGRGRLGIGFVL
jgi:hypothetical protein